MNLISRKDAVALGLKRYFTGKPCLRGHVALRSVTQACCLECRKIVEKKWKSCNRQRMTEQNRVWRERNREKDRTSALGWYERNKERAKERFKQYKALNGEQISRRTKEWRRLNKERVLAFNSKRRALHKRALVPLNKEEQQQVVALYAERNRLELTTGIKYHVDHIVPLSKGGKHHPSNLRVITALENLRKSDKTPIAISGVCSFV